MHHFAVNWWNPDEQQSPQISTRNNNTTVESPKQLFDVPKPLGLQLSDDSSSTQSFGLARQDINGEIESRGKDVESQMKPLFMMSNPDLGSNPPKVDYTHSMDHLPYHYASPCFGCIFPAYGPQALVQLPVNSRMVGISSARLPLPADVAQDEPIYVNPKQYHGILRRRQLRSKLESRNKFIKNRKPYLHESRHLHALNRVRGSGGRFLSTKKVLPESAPATSTQRAANSIQLQLDNNSMLSKGNNHSGPAEYVTSHAAGLDINNISNSGAMIQQPDGRFSSIPSHSGGVLQCIGDCMYSNTNHKSSIFQ